uniref:Uncharacterized protein n=1 Tax=Pseudomonas syringae TaxID=317 RepID=I6QQJ7_PSESX|nr:hypothetical protein [Pseudomonas syringae]
MANPESLLSILPGLIDSIARNQPVIIRDLDDEQLISMLPALTRHKLESIALLSMAETAGMSTFYLQTYHAQFAAIRAHLAHRLKALDCMFLQGFPRCLDFSSFYTPGMRTDIDIYVPAASHTAVRDFARNAGFDYYGFDSENIFVVDAEQSNALTAHNWADKDVALTLLREVELPADLPIEIVDCYLPYVLRNGKTYLFISLEVHHLYTDHSDIGVLEANREPWQEMGVDRCNAEATLYFNLIRLHRGVLAGEARMRLLLDTACLLASRHRPLDMQRFAQLVVDSPGRVAITSVCSTLATLHPLFEALLPALTDQLDNRVEQSWFQQLQHSLRIEPEHV